MELSADLTGSLVAAALPGREVRSYEAMLSTEADALAWARAGAPGGALVVAGYQAAPRGHFGRLLPVEPGAGLGFSMVLRPRLAEQREGWLYTVATCALADVLGDGTTIAWPDELRRDGGMAAAVAVQTEPAPPGLAWAVVTVLVPGARPPRATLLAACAEAIEDRCARSPGDVLDAHTARCETLGRRVCAHLVPMGPSGRRVTGTAAATLKDGALVVETDEGRRVAVPPPSLGVLEEA